MSGFFGVASKTDCVLDLFFGDYAYSEIVLNTCMICMFQFIVGGIVSLLLSAVGLIFNLRGVRGRK